MAVTAAALIGALDGLFAHAAWAQSLGPDAIVRLVGDVAGSSNPKLLPRSLFLYAFSQSVHYGVWLRLIPELDWPSPVPQGWRQASAAAAMRQHDSRGAAIISMLLERNSDQTDRSV